MRKKIAIVASLAFAAALSAGIAGANVNVNADAATWTGFEITATSVRLGEGTKQNPSGLRFQTVASSLTADLKAQYADAECYTTISFTYDGQNYSTDVPVSVWASENSWNTVLLEIPAGAYTTEITAQSFIKLNETTTYETLAVTSSIAKTASLVMNAGTIDAKLDAYVAGAVSSVELDKETVALEAGQTTTLTADAEGYAVVWKSSNTSVATVDKNGVVTAVGAGEATITASVGNAVDAVKDTCTVTATYGTNYTFENGATGSPILKVANAPASDFEYTTVNGTTVLDASSGISRDGEGNNTMLTFFFHLSHDYIDWAMTNHDYVSFDFYATVPYIGYIRAERVNIPEGESGWSIYLHGANDKGNPVKHLKGEALDGGLYKYSITLNQEMYKAIKAKDTDYSFRFSLLGTTNVTNYLNDQVATDVLYFDNLQAHDYTSDVIDFEDGNLHEFGFQWFATLGTSVGVKERTPGNKALYVTGSGNNGVGITAEYLDYVFNTLNAEYLEWKFYPDDTSTVTSTIPKAVRLYTQVDQYGIDNTWSWNGTYMLCKLYKSSYVEAINALNGAAPTKLSLYTYVGAAGAYKAGGYMDDVAPIFLKKTTDVIDFEDGVSSAVIGDYAGKSTTAVVQMENGNWALKVTTSTANNPVGVSMEWLSYVFNELGAQKITYKLYALESQTLSNPEANRSAFFDGSSRWNNDQGNLEATDTQWFQTYDAEGGFWLSECRANQYFTYFNTDGTSKKGWTSIGFANLFRPVKGTNATGCYIDDITIVL